MASLQAVVDTWDMGHWELGEVLEGLADEDLWRRPHPKHLSIGEMMGHMAYWEATRFTGALVENDPRGPLVDARFRYYDPNVDEPVALDMGVAEAMAQLKAVHEAAAKVVRDRDPDSQDKPGPEISGMWEGATWGDLVNYMAFHVGYHTGQAASVRHLLGSEFKDN
ncbi:MAG: DinB family protein [Fimbriimonadaceae bacterium]|nr:DinB family protein [Fimbriimonadaceae bacterium]QYK57441.1 MAG: DinB family protein [Fimbriimonadaceae bacterium]